MWSHHNHNTTPQRTLKMSVKNQSYPCGKPDNMEYVRDQIHLAHKYANASIENERSRQAAQDAVLADTSPRLVAILQQTAEIDSRVEAVLKSIAAEKQRVRGAVDCESQREELAALSDRRWALSRERWDLVVKLIAPMRKANDAARKAIVLEYQSQEDAKAAEEKRPPIRRKLMNGDDWRRSLPPDADRRLADIEWEATRRKNDLNREYSNKGLNWGTRGHIDQSLKPAKGKPAVTKFHRWDGCGSIRVKITGGVTWGEVRAGQCRSLRVEVADNKLFLTITPDVTRRQSVVVRTRIDIESDRLPDEARITDVALIQTRVGQMYHYNVMLTVDREEKRIEPTSGVCGIDVGWRKLPHGLRVAMLTGVDRCGEAKQIELRLPRTLLSALQHATSVQSLRDLLMNEITATIRGIEGVPEAVLEESKAACRSTDQLSRAVWKWEDRPFVVEEWRKLNKRLENEQRHLARKVQRRRDSIYRLFARYVADNYAACSVDDMDLRELHKRPGLDEDRVVYGATLRNVAAAGTLRRFIREAMLLRCVDVATEYTSQVCNNCGTTHSTGAALLHACPGCAVVLDQDCLASTAIVLANRAVTEKDREVLDRYRTTSSVETWVGVLDIERGRTVAFGTGDTSGGAAMVYA